MNNTISLGQWTMMVVYVMLFGVWFTVVIKTDDVLRFRRPPMESPNYSKIHYAFRVVAISFLLDSFYWAITNITEVVQNHQTPKPESVWRNPWFIAVIKLIVLISAIVFYSTVKRVSDALNREFQEAYFSKLVNQTWDAVGILDTDGRVRIWNKGAKELFGWSEHKVLNMHIKDFLVPPDLHREIDSILEDIATNHIAYQHFDTVRLTAGGERVPVDISISPIMDPDFRGYFGIMRKAMTKPFTDFRYFAPDERRRHTGGYVFVAMPLNPGSVPQDVYSVAIRDAIEGNNLVAVRTDEEMLTGVIINQIFNDIRGATLVIADLTGKNPNVFYEVGLAHMMGKPVVQLIGNGDKIPFDLAHIRTIEYDFNDLADLRKRLNNAIQDHLETSPQIL